MRLFGFVIFFVFNFSYKVNANEEFIQKALDYLLRYSEVDENDIEPIVTKLNDYLVNPLPINTADIHELSEFPLFTQQQIMHIINYRKQKGFIRIPEEWDLLPAFNLELIEIIQPFISYYVEVPSLNKQPVCKVEVLNRYKRSISFLNSKDSLRIGSPNAYWTRLIVKNFTPGISLGINVEKDAGELYLYPSKGISFQSGYLEYKNKHKTIKHLIIGDYQVNFGQGIAVNSGFSNVKSNFIQQSASSFQIRKISPHRSSSETGFFKGFASLIKWHNWEGVFFASHQNQDATLSENVNGHQYLSSLSSTGYHTNETEIKKWNVLEVTDLGSSISYKQKLWNVSWNQNYTLLNIPLIPDSTYYNAGYLNGKNFYVSSMDYHALYKNIHFFGEGAIDKNLKTAFLLGSEMKLSEEFDFTFLCRNYDEYFQSFRGQSFQENTHLSNEKGCFIGLKTQWQNWNFSAYQDVFKFPGMKYLVRSSSFGQEKQVLAEYQSESNWKIILRWKNAMKQKNKSEGATEYSMQNYNTNSFRIHLITSLSENWKFQSRVEYSSYSVAKSSSNGWLAFQDVKYQKNNFALSARFSLFSVNDFDARIYVYENDLLYSYPIKFYHNKGCSYYFNLCYNFNKKLKMHLKTQVTKSKDINNVPYKNECTIALQLISAF